MALRCSFATFEPRRAKRSVCVGGLISGLLSTVLLNLLFLSHDLFTKLVDSQFSPSEFTEVIREGSVNISKTSVNYSLVIIQLYLKIFLVFLSLLMALHFVNLDVRTREFMLAEMELDISQGNLYK